MVATRTSKTTTKEEPDLLAELSESNSTPPVDDNEDFDLLSDMSESDATAWYPWDAEDQPNGIQGKVVHIGTVMQDAKYGGGDVPYIELQDRSDPDLVWGIRGYASVLADGLQREIDNDLRNGDILAVVYQGIQTSRGGNDYKKFRVKSQHVGH